MLHKVTQKAFERALTGIEDPEESYKKIRTGFVKVRTKRKKKKKEKEAHLHNLKSFDDIYKGIVDYTRKNYPHSLDYLVEIDENKIFNDFARIFPITPKHCNRRKVKVTVRLRDPDSTWWCPYTYALDVCPHCGHINEH